MAEWRQRLRAKLWPTPAHVRHLFLLLLLGLAIALLIGFTVKGLDGSRGLQVTLAAIGFSSLVLFVIWNEEIGLVEGLGLAIAVIALASTLIGGLVFPGPIESDSGRITRCVDSDGRNEATVSAKNTSIYPEADHASTPVGLLLEGCTFRFDDYCIGTVQTDAQYEGVKDSRWLILSDDQLVASAHTVGFIPPDQAPTTCPGGLKPPDRIVFRKAVLSSDGLLELDATAPRAAVVGFALMREGGRWLRLGWDPSPNDAFPEVFVAPAIARPGDLILATPCMAFGRPIGPTRQLRLTAGPVEGEPEPFRQPVHSTAVGAACDAGIAEG